LAQIIDIIFAILLIFGKGGFPEYGLLGCAIATLIAQVSSLLAIFPFFFTKQNRETFHTGHCRFSITSCWRYMRFGIPSSLNSFVNGTAWCWIIQVMANRISFSEFSALGIIFTLLRILSLLSESLGKGNCILIANFLGEKQDKITLRTILPVALKSWLMMACILLLLIWIFAREFVAFFVANENLEILSMFWQMLPWASLLTILEGIWLQLHYSLTAFKDTSFLASVNIGSHFIFLIVPAYFFLAQEHPHAVIILQLIIVHQFVRSCILQWRYKVQITKAIASEE
jgi:MATE family multidrug resistance protein